MMELAQLLPPQSLDADPVLEFEAGLEQAARELDLDPWLVQRLKHGEREIAINIPVRRDDGSAVNVSSYRVQHSRANGPCIGPVTLAPAAHPAALRITAAAITLQSALLDLPFGGASGAIVCDPAQFGEQELRHVVHHYVGQLRDNTGPLQDVLVPEGPDWFSACVHEMRMLIHGCAEPAAAAGRRNLGPAVASSTIALIRRAMNLDDLSHVRVAIQGFGHTARALAQALRREHADIIAVADRSGAVLRQDGLDLDALCSYVADSGVVFGYPNAEPATNADVLECACDLLVLAAAERQVGAHNAAHIRARLVLELTQAAVAVAAENLPGGCTLLPFLIAGCPRLGVWAYEWQRGLSYSDVIPEEAVEYASARVVRAFDLVRALATAERIPLGHAATLSAVERLAGTLRG